MFKIRFAVSIVLAGLLLLCGSAAFSDEVYRWVDKEGVTHLQDAASGGIPAGQTVEKKVLAPQGRIDPVSGVHQVEIYTSKGCSHCHDAKAYLQKRGIPFIEHDIEKDDAARRRRDEVCPAGGVPVAVIDGKVVRGFSPDIYDEIFGKSP